jgi:hypothetical protein
VTPRPLGCEELCRLAKQKMAQEKPGRTLQAMASVHEAYIQLVDVEKRRQSDSRGHFFSAVGEAADPGRDLSYISGLFSIIGKG